MATNLLSLKRKNGNEAPRTTPVIVVLVTLSLAALGAAGYFYYQYRQSTKTQGTEEVMSLKTEVGRIFELPTGEEPTLATVTDKEKLVDQPFFAKAENGDKVLIYSQSGRAVLYRPSLKKVIDVVAVNPLAAQGLTDKQSQSTTPETSPQPLESISTAIRVAIYNGSGEAGAGTNLQSQIHTLYPDITFPTVTNAAQSYTDSRVIDLTGKNSILAQAFANLVKGTIRTLPEGESAPTDADVLIIVGKKP